CLIRGDNAFARANRDKLQQIFLASREVLAGGEGDGGAERVSIELLAGFPRDVYALNASPESREYWQVFDRTTGEELPRERWRFLPDKGAVEVSGARRWHRYGADFLAFEIWESINRYNHRVNNWKTEPEMPLDPAHPEVRERMKANLAAWLDRNPHVSVVRFTTFYYGNGRGGWGDYGRTVSPRALELFRQRYGYRLTAETFTNGGLYNPTHRPPSKEYADWMAFQHDFFMETTRPLVDMIHARGKKAFFLLGDQWIGSEPLEGRFAELGMDGVVKSVFNGFEARIAGATESVPVREIRFHPYFFPKEVTGKPTFCPEGTPTEDLRTYWADIRRACLRVRIDRIGFGGYVSLLEKFPDFVEYVAEVSRQARTIRALHEAGAPYAGPVNVAVLSSWGRTRAWMCSGHMQHASVYNQMLESLSGLPVGVEFLSFREVAERGLPAHVNVVVNAGRSGTAWSGGEAWRDPALVERLTEFVARGGGLVGLGEPSACEGGDRFFRLAHVLGVDREPVPGEGNADYGGWLEAGHFIAADAPAGGGLEFVSSLPNLELVSPDARVVAWVKTGECAYFHKYLQPQIVANRFRSGRSVYFAGFKYNPANTRALGRALFWAAGQEAAFDEWRCDDLHAECAYFPGAGRLAVVNNSREARRTAVHLTGGGRLELELEPLALAVREV
ncbi:Lacto-N-biose phosphorylase, partial [sediment metagenome]